ncbi:MAG TPA: hypothetical protein VMB73_30390 [Acetobacteraceae bacterium]|nr:hypothetical protein [Acetobacteraceae bacterium]
MSTAAAIVSARAAQPDLTRAGARASATPNAVAAFVAFVCNLVLHSKNLAFTFANCVRKSGHGLTARFFGTSIIDAIVARLRHGVMRRLALPEMLSHRAWRGVSVWLPVLWRRRISPGQAGADARAIAAAQHNVRAIAAAQDDNAPAKDMRSTMWQTCDLSHLPAQDLSDRPANGAAAQAAAREARRRKAGAIAAGTCLASSITAETAGLVWYEPLVATRRFRISLTRFSAEVDRCKAPASRVETPRFGVPPEHPHLDSLSAEEQSSDHAPPQAASAECPSPEAEPCPETCETFEPTETAPAMTWPVSLPTAQEVAAAALR